MAKTSVEKWVNDALLNQYEEGMDSATIDGLFEALKKDLIPFVKEILAKQKPENPAFIVVNGQPEVLIPSQNIFIEPGLAFVKPHVTAAAGYGVVIWLPQGRRKCRGDRASFYPQLLFQRCAID